MFASGGSPLFVRLTRFAAAPLMLALLLTAAGFGPVPSTRRVLACSCPDCPDPIADVPVVASGRFVGSEVPRGADGRPHETEIQFSLKRVEAYVLFEVDRMFKGDLPPVARIRYDLYATSDPDLLEWARTSCDQVTEDPTGLPAIVLVERAPDGTLTARRPYGIWLASSVEDQESRVAALVASGRVGAPYPPGAGTGLQFDSGGRRLMGGGAALVGLGFALAALAGYRRVTSG